MWLRSSRSPDPDQSVGSLYTVELWPELGPPVPLAGSALDEDPIVRARISEDDDELMLDVERRRAGHHRQPIRARGPPRRRCAVSRSSAEDEHA